jgi:hypothetical protein
MEVKNEFFSVEVESSDAGYQRLVRMMDQYLEKSHLSDALFEMFLAIKKYAVPGSIVGIKAGKKGNVFELAVRFTMRKDRLLQLDGEIASANELKGRTKHEIIASRMKEYKRDNPPKLDGFKMVMAYGQGEIRYRIKMLEDVAEVEIFMDIEEQGRE